MSNDPQHHARAAQGRLAGLVIAFTGALWVGATWAGTQLGWSNRALALIGLAAMGGFAFGLVVALRIWLQGRKDEG